MLSLIVLIFSFTSFLKRVVSFRDLGSDVVAGGRVGVGDAVEAIALRWPSDLRGLGARDVMAGSWLQ